jgi:YVTN family beta-propeller protein
MENIKMQKTLFSIAVAATAFMSISAFAEPFIYVAAGSANKVLVIDSENNQVVNEFDGIRNPHALAITPDGEYVISASLAAKKNEMGKMEGTLFVIHPEHGHIMSTRPLPGMVHHQAIKPTGRYVVSTHPTLGGVSITDLDGSPNDIFLKTGNGPNYTVFTKDGGRAFISNTGSGTISEVDTVTWKVIRTLDGGPTPEHLALSKDQKKLYSVNAKAGTVSETDIASGKVTRSFSIGKGAHGLDLSEDGQSMYATSKKSGVAVKIDIENETRTEIQLAPSPYHLEALTGTGKVFVSSSKSPKIWVIDAQTFKPVDEIAISGEGHQMVLSATHTD